MNFKSEKGITGVDISVAIIIIMLFVSLISTLIYNYTKNSKELNRKSVATNIIVDVLEYAKSIDYDSLDQQTLNNYCSGKQEQGYRINAALEELADEKKVIVKVTYTINKDEQNLEIYTIIKNPNVTEKEGPIWNIND